MQQATTTQLREAPTRPRIACIRLTRGASEHGAWVLEEGEGGTFLTIGSAPDCEWRIRAASVPAHALFVLLIGAAVYARSGPQGGVRLDGVPLTETWQQVHADARLDIGLASLEVKLSDDVLLPPLVETAPNNGPWPTAMHSQPGLADADQSGVRRSFTPEPGVERASEPSSAASTRPSILERFSRMSRISLFEAPSVLGKEPHASGKIWPYVLGSIVLAAAYVAWLWLLDG